MNVLKVQNIFGKGGSIRVAVSFRTRTLVAYVHYSCTLPAQYDGFIIKDKDLETKEVAQEYHDNIVTSDRDVIIDLDDDEEEKNVSQ